MEREGDSELDDEGGQVDGPGEPEKGLRREGEGTVNGGGSSGKDGVGGETLMLLYCKSCKGS